MGVLIGQNVCIDAYGYIRVTGCILCFYICACRIAYLRVTVMESKRWLFFFFFLLIYVPRSQVRVSVLICVRDLSCFEWGF